MLKLIICLEFGLDPEAIADTLDRVGINSGLQLTTVVVTNVSLTHYTRLPEVIRTDVEVGTGRVQYIVERSVQVIAVEDQPRDLFRTGVTQLGDTTVLYH
ncbi:hypothetical protein D3C80_1373300 [compost metagenome]